METLKKENDSKLHRLDKIKRITSTIKKEKQNEQRQAHKKWEEEEQKFEYFVICGRIIAMPNGQSALCYITIKRMGTNVIVQQEIANDDEKNKNVNAIGNADNCVQTIQKRKFFNKSIAEIFAKNV